MKLHHQIRYLLENSSTFLISTIDSRDFPTTIVVSPPIKKEGLQHLEFYLNGGGETAQNILKRKKGAVCCYQEAGHSSLVLKGNFTLRKFSLEDQKFLNAYQDFLQHQDPVIAVFETMICKIHVEGQTRSFIF